MLTDPLAEWATAVAGRIYPLLAESRRRTGRRVTRILLHPADHESLTFLHGFQSMSLFGVPIRPDPSVPSGGVTLESEHP